MTSRLQEDFFARPTLDVAQTLLGKKLVFFQHHAIITETEAYIGQNDPACHAARGKTPRNAVMFERAGLSYVYLIYGMYHCLNFVTEVEGFPAAVLIRGLQEKSVPNSDFSFLKRTQEANTPTLERNKNFLNGPGKLCKAFGITREHNHIDITIHPDFYVEDIGVTLPFTATPRIGIREGKDLLWRFVAHLP